MGSCAGDGEWPCGVTGEDAEVGALVWVRRRNGSWWPGRILGMDELPENIVIPPRSAGTPIKLLGRPDGSICRMEREDVAYVSGMADAECIKDVKCDWYNLEKSKRVKPFRCGEYDECIEKAKILARQQKRAYTEGRYVRREDAILHALEIERSRFPNKHDDGVEEDLDSETHASQNMYSAKSKNINGLNKRSSQGAWSLCDIEENSAQGLCQTLVMSKQPQNTSSASTRYASSSKRKQRAQKDFQHDTVQRGQRMRDLREIETKNVPKQKSCAGLFSDGHQNLPLLESRPSFGYDLSSTNGIKKGKQSHSSIKRKRSNIRQSYENSRKKDRRRTLSKLCKDSELTISTYWDRSGQSSSQYPGDKMLNMFKSSRGETNFSADVNNGTYSSGTSSVETLLDTSHTNHKNAGNNIEVKDAEVLDDCSSGDELLDAASMLEEDAPEEGYLKSFGSCGFTKGQISKPNDQITYCSKGGQSSIREHICSKKKSINSITIPISQENHKQGKNLLLQQYEGTIKCQGLDTDTVGLDARVYGATVPADDRPEHDESAETISNNSNTEKGAASIPFYTPLQVLLPAQRPARRHVMGPTKNVRSASKLYDIELTVQRSYQGHHVPLVSLMSKWTGKPIVGYPVTVEILENSCPAAPSTSDHHHPANSSLNFLLKSRAAGPRQARSANASRSKHTGRKKISEHDLDKSWRPHTKKPASSPMKMRRLSSFASSRRDSANRKPVVAKVGGPTVACVPLRLVFSRLNEAFNLAAKPENPT
ncbi:hypothetical protein ACP4OV_010556 [Aristida adscensionis]